MNNENEIVHFEKIFSNEKFEMHTTTGSKNSPMMFMTFSPTGPDGKAVNDTMSISDTPAVVASFSGPRRLFPAYADIGKGHTKAGAKAMMWDEPFVYWCVCDINRPLNDWIISGDVYQPRPQSEIIKIPVKAGDYLAVVRGSIRYDDEDHTNLSVEEMPEARVIDVVTGINSLIFVITATPA